MEETTSNEGTSTILDRDTPDRVDEGYGSSSNRLGIRARVNLQLSVRIGSFLYFICVRLSSMYRGSSRDFVLIIAVIL